MQELINDNKKLHDELAVLEAKAKEDFERARINERLAHDCNCDLSAVVNRIRENVEKLMATMELRVLPVVERMERLKGSGTASAEAL